MTTSPQLSYKVILSFIFLAAGLYSCKSNDKKIASLDNKKTEVAAPVAPQTKKDSTMKYVQGPKMPGVSCCKGMPSRAKALAAKK